MWLEDIFYSTQDDYKIDRLSFRTLHHNWLFKFAIDCSDSIMIWKESHSAGGKRLLSELGIQRPTGRRTYLDIYAYIFLFERENKRNSGLILNLNVHFWCFLLLRVILVSSAAIGVVSLIPTSVAGWYLKPFRNPLRSLKLNIKNDCLAFHMEFSNLSIFDFVGNKEVCQIWWVAD